MENFFQLGNFITLLDNNFRTKLKNQQDIEKILGKSEVELTSKYLKGYQQEGMFNIDFTDVEYYDKFSIKTRIVLLFTYFETYVYNIANYILKKYPQIMNSKKVEVEKMLKLSKKEILREIREEKISQLLYDSILKLPENLENGFNLNIEVDSSHVEELYFYNQIRNLIIHSNGIVNSTFSKRIERSELFKEIKGMMEIDSKLEITIKNSIDCGSVVYHFVRNMDESVIKQLKEVPKYLPKNLKEHDKSTDNE